MKTLIGLLVIGILITASCNSPGTSRSTITADLPYQVDLEQNMGNVKPVPLSTVGKELEYIPLETHPDCMIRRIAGVALSDSFIFVSDGSKLMLFDRNGKFLRQIGSTGRGPEEYSSVRDFYTDRDNKEVYILASGKVMAFGFNGQYKKSFNADFRPSQIVRQNVDAFMFHLFNMSGASEDTAYSWYITDKDGVILAKIRNYHKRISMPGLIVPNSPLYLFNKNPHFLEFGIDTLYYFQNGVKEPYAIFYPGKMKMEPDLLLTPDTFREVADRIKEKIWINNIRENNEFLFLEISWGLSDSLSYCIFEKSTSELIVLNDNGFVNDMDGGAIFWPKHIHDDNTLVDYMDAFDLLQVIKAKQSGELKESVRRKSNQIEVLGNELTETSNPVLMVLK